MGTIKVIITGVCVCVCRQIATCSPLSPTADNCTGQPESRRREAGGEKKKNPTETLYIQIPMPLS